MKAKAIKKYRQRETGKVILPGAVVEVTVERLAEINSHPKGPFLSQEAEAAKTLADAHKKKSKKPSAPAAGEGDPAPVGASEEI